MIKSHYEIEIRLNPDDYDNDFYEGENKTIHTRKQLLKACKKIVDKYGDKYPQLEICVKLWSDDPDDDEYDCWIDILRYDTQAHKLIH